MRICGRGSAPAASVRPRALGGSLTVVLALTGCDGLSPGTGRQTSWRRGRARGGRPSPGTGRQTRSSQGDPRQRPDHPGGGVAAGSYRSPVRRRAAAPAPSPMPPGAWSISRPGPCTPPSPGAGARRRPAAPPPPPPPAPRSASPILTAPGGVPPTRTRAARSASTSPRAPTSTASAHPRARAARGRLNRRPREVLNGQTPTEILDTIINGATTPRHRPVPAVVLECEMHVSASGARRRRAPWSARSPGNRRDRHLTREYVTLADVLAG